ncbi:MAG: hypothetical protein QNJ15_15965, partial [Erythrobacter sp.]|nr:hypothetical protein [Erythrobacter sp.]
MQFPIVQRQSKFVRNCRFLVIEIASLIDRDRCDPGKPEQSTGTSSILHSLGHRSLADTEDSVSSAKEKGISFTNAPFFKQVGAELLCIRHIDLRSATVALSKKSIGTDASNQDWSDGTWQGFPQIDT